jgi:hypothetical protein
MPTLLSILEHELKETESRLAVFTALYQANLEHRPAPERQRAYFLGRLTLEYGLTAMRRHHRWLLSVSDHVRAGAYTPACLGDVLRDA